MILEVTLPRAASTVRQQGDSDDEKAGFDSRRCKTSLSEAAMGAFNTVKSEASCPFCGNGQRWTIQFKYGDCWQYSYSIGDKLRWGGNKKASNVGGSVRTEGVAEERCRECGRNSLNAAIYFTDNIIKRIELLKEPLQLQDYFEMIAELSCPARRTPDKCV
jgi:hypothetical protein